jgi:hypothetical protein
VTGADAEKSVVILNGRELPANQHGLVQWTSARPPKRLRVRTPEAEMEVSGVRWSRPRQT